MQQSNKNLTIIYKIAMLFVLNVPVQYYFSNLNNNKNIIHLPKNMVEYYALKTKYIYDTFKD